MWQMDLIGYELSSLHQIEEIDQEPEKRKRAEKWTAVAAEKLLCL